MKKCLKCNVKINTRIDECPLCNSTIKINKTDYNVYPKIESKFSNFKLLKNILMLLSTLGVIVSLLINYLINKEITWAYFVIGAEASFWCTFLSAVKKRRNFLKLLFTELNIIVLDRKSVV